MAIRKASTSPSIFFALRRVCTLGLSAESNPSNTKRLRTLSMVSTLVCIAFDISVSLSPPVSDASSACNKIWACVRLRAATLPVLISLVDNLREVNTFIADKGYDSDKVRKYITKKGGKSVIPKRNYGQDIDKGSFDWCLYGYRHLVENAFARIKHFRAVSTRYDKLCRNYASTLALAFATVWLPMHVD